MSTLYTCKLGKQIPKVSKGSKGQADRRFAPCAHLKPIVKGDDDGRKKAKDP